MSGIPTSDCSESSKGPNSNSELEDAVSSQRMDPAVADGGIQQNVQQFAEAFEIQTEMDKLEWFRSVKIDPWTNRFTKDDNVAEDMERTYWEQESKFHQPALSSMTTIWMAFNFFILICDMHPIYLTMETPNVIKMVDFRDSYIVALVFRLLVFFVLLTAKLTKFFIGPHCRFLKSKWTLLVGMSVIQIAEMILAMLTIDDEPGIHCIIMLIMFNFTPQRLVEKAPVCICTYAVWFTSLFIWSATWEKDAKYQELWGFPKEQTGFFNKNGCTLCYQIINLLTVTGVFMAVQIYIVFVREEHLSQNLLAIKIGEVQSTIISKRNKTNQMLLDSMLPQEITKEIPISSDDNLTYVESYTDVTVLFCMIDNFGEISSTFDAIELVSILNGVYSGFDDLADAFGSIYKVETVGEVYMMAGGCPRRTVTHATDAAEMALAMVRLMPEIRVQIKDAIFDDNSSVDNREKKMDILDKLSIKIGLNTGQVTAGVIGATCQRFKLFGDTVNTASRMESRSLPNKVQISDTTFKQLVKAKNFLFKKREPMPIKGKGIMQTYFVQGMSQEAQDVEHDSLDTLVTREDQIKFNFVDVCKKAIKESQSKDGGHGEMDAFSKALQDTSILGGTDAEDLNIEEESTSNGERTKRNGMHQLDEANQTSHFIGTFNRLQARAKPQLPVNQTLLFLFGYDIQAVKPSTTEAMLEAHYRLHIFCKERK